ncbi:MAG: hypothetical protein JKY37_25375 [Nannocystaceae bacterium]|nr:hypothetical protein [Nannocystaceae bacterium]
MVVSTIVRGVALIFLVATLGLSACATTGAGRRSWTHYKLGTVDIYSGAPKRRTEQLVYDFARYRVVVKTLSASTSVEPRVPTSIFIFPDHHSYQRHSNVPRSAGLFVRSDEWFTLALDGSRGSSAGQEVLFHEYAHLIVDNVAGLTFPDWYHEGMAEFMATIRFTGGEVRLGEVSERNHAAVGAYNRWVPLAELMQGNFQSVGDPERLHRYYAQSWLLAHYLQMSDRADTSQLPDYLQLVHDGGDPVASVHQAFGVTTLQLEKELREYVRQAQFAYQLLPQSEFDFSGLEQPSMDPLTPGVSALKLAVLCTRLHNFERARILADAAEAAGENGPELDMVRAALAQAR